MRVYGHMGLQATRAIQRCSGWQNRSSMVAEHSLPHRKQPAAGLQA